MSGFMPFIPPMGNMAPTVAFDMLIAREGLRTVWMQSHACPCTFAGGGPNGALPYPGSAAPGCLTCFGTGIYWDNPSAPFKAHVAFMHMSPTPDEPGTFTNPKDGSVISAEPTITIPYTDPVSGTTNPAWGAASTFDLFITVDAMARYTAKLQVGGITAVPYQQNMHVAPTGAVTVYDQASHRVVPVSGYVVSGTAVTISGYDEGTNYMVEFYAAPIYVAYRIAGGLPHVRPLGGGSLAYPRRFRLQTLDEWTRSRNVGPVPNYSAGGGAFPFSSA